MAWSHKEEPNSLDNQPIEGLFFLIGDAIARQDNISWIIGEKLPLIKFPSGLPCEVWESREPGNPIIHLFGEMDLPYRDTRDSAYAHALDIAEQVGYAVQKAGDTQLEIWGDEGRFLVTYDSDAGHMVNVEPVRSKPERLPRPPLLDAETWKKLPPLRGQEHLLLKALVQVKFFTPDAQWTWYASEATAQLVDDTYVPLQEISPDDPRIVDVIFFGLVNGYELELGYFTLEELAVIRGPLGLPVERDLYFQPKTLAELQAFHEGGETR